ncbi:TPA: Fic family protein, partial [Streptococcus pyogenes]|nr:Fic family protein [Streptococcus pyogenes]
MKPPFTVTNTMLNKVVEISKIIGNLELQVQKDLKLRKENRIQSIHSSLAIEQNSLTVEQITAIIDGKRVLGNPREIREVKNAYEAYEEILTLTPYDESHFLKAHGLLTAGIVNATGKYRSKDVGVYDEAGNVVHMGARPQFIAELMRELFNWGKTDDTPEIIKSCVFHYEIEMIHPFEDGNGRMGRLWQTVILANWHPIFAWIPIETLIYENQKAYYDALGKADKENSSNTFIEFMLD